MTKMKRVSLVFVIIMVMSALIIYFINCTNIKYDISDAVTYFDEQGRYQLVNSVNQDYAIYDAEKRKVISDFLLYYVQVDNKVYFITNPGRKTIAYAILDIVDNQYSQFFDLNELEDDEKRILENKGNMVDLTKERSHNLKPLSKFIPTKWRKW